MATVTFDGTRTDAADAVGTVWVDYGNKSTATEPDFIYQNTASISEKIGTTRGGIVHLPASSIDMSTTPRGAIFQVIATNNKVLNVEGSQGGILDIGSGGFQSAYYQYYVVGGDTYPPTQSWLFFYVDPNVTAYRDNTVGSPSLTAVNYLAWSCDFTTTSKAENVAMDAFQYINSGTGLTATGTAGVFNDFVSFDEGTAANRYGVITTRAGTLYCIGTLTFGTASSLVFDDSNIVVVFPFVHCNVDHQGLKIDLQNASTDITFTNCVFKSQGRDNLKRFFDTDHQVDDVNEELDIVGHGYSNGDAVLYSKEGGTEAIGLTDATEYWVEVVSADIISLHTTRQNAMTAATPVGLTASTSGNGENHSIRRQPRTTPHLTVSGTSGTFLSNGCNYVRWGTVTGTSGATFSGSTFVQLWQMTLAGCEVTGCTFNGATTVEGEYMISEDVTDIAAIDNTDFVAGAFGGHALRVTSGGATLGLTNVGFTGYGNDPSSGKGMPFDTITSVDATNDEIDYTTHGWTTGDAVYYTKRDPDDGSLGTDSLNAALTDNVLVYVRAVTANAVSLHWTRYAAQNNLDKIVLTDGSTGEQHTLYSADAAIVNDKGAALTINVTGGDVPSVRNIGASTTTVSASVTVTVTPVFVGSEVRAYLTGTNTEVGGGVENSAGTSVALSLTSGTAVDIIVLSTPTASRPNDTPAIPRRIENVSFTSSQTLDPFQREDPNFNNP